MRGAGRRVARQGHPGPPASGARRAPLRCGQSRQSPRLSVRCCCCCAGSQRGPCLSGCSPHRPPALQGDLDQGLSEIASASRTYPLAMLQYFPTLLPDPKAALATMDKSHMSARTRALLGLVTPRDPSPRWQHPRLPEPVQLHERSAGPDAADGASMPQVATERARAAPGTTRPRLRDPVDTPPALAIPYLVTFRSRMLSRTTDEVRGTLTLDTRPSLAAAMRLCTCGRRSGA